HGPGPKSGGAEATRRPHCAQNDFGRRGSRPRHERARATPGSRTMSERLLRIFEEGHGKYLPVDPDGFRDATGKKTRALVSKLVTAREAVERYVADGDYITWECNYLQRGPSVLIREIVRQRKRRLWACGKFTWVAIALLVEADCCDRADMGFFMGG